MPVVQVWFEDTVYDRLRQAVKGQPKVGREKPMNTYIREAVIDRLNRDKVVVPEPVETDTSA